MPTDLILGDVLEVVRGMPDESFTACFCDPPYGLKFMGKEWDHGVPSKEVWAEVLRVLKPGAVLMAFGGTRTWHRLAVAIEDAGFDIFDTVMWLYGSGFPKSASISKMLDKAAGAKREIVGIGRSGPALKLAGTNPRPWHETSRNDAGQIEFPITVSATDVAKTWEGYGTALKPSWEPILLARKPRRATYAATAMEHGTACLNIDGCRVAHDGNVDMDAVQRQHADNPIQFGGAKPGDVIAMYKPGGRWPANLLFSHSDCERVGLKRVRGTHPPGPNPGGLNRGYVGGTARATENCPPAQSYADPDGLETVAAYRCSPDCPVAMLDRQSGVSKSGAAGKKGSSGFVSGYNGDYEIPYGDKGGASRFFQCFERFYYCPKASRKERDMGLEAMPTGQGFDKNTSKRIRHVNPDTRAVTWSDYEPSVRRNPHPTVKPLALCEYLARLIVPPEEYRDEAALLVPFCGTASEIIGALKAGWRNVTGIDIVAEYLEIARLRIAAHMKRSQQRALEEIDG